MSPPDNPDAIPCSYCGGTPTVMHIRAVVPAAPGEARLFARDVCALDLIRVLDGVLRPTVEVASGVIP